MWRPLATSQQPQGARGGYEPFAGAFKGPPTRFLLHFKADMKQTSGKELKSPADTPAKCLITLSVRPAPLSVGWHQSSIWSLTGAGGRKNVIQCNRWHELLRVCRLDDKKP